MQRHHAHPQARQTYHPVHSSQLLQETPAQPYSRILSWQMSQSLNGYPWRVRHDNVPFFTFPSTPPSFLPSSQYPYTFAPPISINQIPPVPNQVPPYPGIPISTVTGVDSVVPGAVGGTFPMAALTPLTEVPGEQLHNVPSGTVGVTIGSGGHPVPQQTVVIQRPIIQQPPQEVGLQNHDMAMFHAVSHPPSHPPPSHPHHSHHHHIHPGHTHFTTSQIPPLITPAIIVGDGAQPVPVASVIQPGPNMMQPGPNVIQAGPNMIQPGPNMIQAGPNMIQPGPNMIQAGPSMIQPAPSMIQPGPNMMQSGPLVTTMPPPHLISVNGPHVGVLGVSLGPSALSLEENQPQVPRRTAAMALTQEHRHALVASDSIGTNSEMDSRFSLSLNNIPTLNIPDDAVIPSIMARSTAANATVPMASDGAGPSRINADSSLASDSDSVESDSLSTQLAAIFYDGRHFSRYQNDSDDDSSIDISSGPPLSYRLGRGQMSDSSEDNQMTSDPDDSSGLSDSDNDVLANPSTLRLISTNAVTVNNTPSPEAIEEPSASGDQPDSETMLIADGSNSIHVSTVEATISLDEEGNTTVHLNTTHSDTGASIANVHTPPSVIDLTASSANSSPGLEVTVTPNPSLALSDPRVVRNHSTNLRDPRDVRNPSSCIVSSNPSEDVFIVPHGNDRADGESSRHSAFPATSTSVRTTAVGVQSSQSRDVHHSNHSALQLAQPHTRQHYVPHQQHDQAHNILHASNDQTTQSVFPFSSHLVHGGERSSVGVQVTSHPPHLPPPTDPLQLDTSSSVNQHSVHVLAWQQHLPGTNYYYFHIFAV